MNLLRGIAWEVIIASAVGAVIGQTFYLAVCTKIRHWWWHR